MLFNSYQYVLFLPIVLAFYFSTPARFRWAILLSASYVFYMAWEPAYAILIFASTAVDYVVGLQLGRSQRPRMRSILLLVSLVVNLGLLFTFKYFNFFRTVVADVTSFTGASWEFPQLDVLLPVGISFYTFQTLSYTIDIYRGKKEPERHFGVFALYVSFFPQLVAGPIERSYRLLPQLNRSYRFHYPDAVEGLQLILWGLFKKMVIADSLALVVDKVYATPESYPGSVLVLATLFFAFQIYCDFSGYSDIAIGSARMLGIRLMTNFNRPYTARSIQDFWQRWHISLSTWFRDYVYIPLGGNQCPRLRWYLNLLIVFVLSGLWHGANWTFLMWGLVHALLYLSWQMTSRARAAIAGSGLSSFHNTLSLILTFVSVNLAWVFFRADSIGDAAYIFGHLHQGWSLVWHGDAGLSEISRLLEISPSKIQFMAAVLGFMVIVEWVQKDMTIADLMKKIPKPLRWATYVVATVIILNEGTAREIPFVYFQF
jgi:D-alanyl-lipoteichoic acid acyltransferase DltB (MBOAT superfamily)